jgi:integrase
MIVLPASTVAVLREHGRGQAAERLAALDWHEEHGLVFTGPDGTPLSPATVTRTFARHVRDAELPTLTLHGLRHTWATLALEAGIPSKIVAEVLGHTSARTTEDLYQHVTPGMQADATARVAALIRR